MENNRQVRVNIDATLVAIFRIMYYYILKKWRQITVLEILYTLYMHLYFDTFTTRWEGTGICEQMQIVYDDANITLRFQDNKQNCRRIVTGHKYTFILIRYNNRR